MSLIDRFFGKGRLLRAARRAELAGDLGRAAELFGEAGATTDAARVLVARSDAELEPKARLALLGRAIELGPTGSAPRDEARRRRAAFFLELAESGALPLGMKDDLRRAAADLESLGEPKRAADAYRLLGDDEGRTRALVASGDVEELEFALHEDATADRDARDLRSGIARADTLLAGGERRAALAELEALARRHPMDDALRARVDGLRASRIVGHVVHVARGSGPAERWVLGSSVEVGRSEGSIVVPHAAISRTHLRIARGPNGTPEVSDTGSRNGTLLRGVRLGGALPVTDAITLSLGGEVPCAIAPHAGGVIIDIAGERYHAALGPSVVVDGWTLETTSDDGWIALLTTRPGAAFLGSLATGRVVELLAGDAFSDTRDGVPVARFDR